jgi:hypothetical protein
MATMISERVINARYRLIKKLGEGGMGTVWLADDLQLRRTVALKQLLPRLGTADLAERRQRAINEARAMAAVNHPAIVRIYDVFPVDEDPWIVMEYIEGRSFYDLIKEGPLDEREIARIALPVLRGLHAAHGMGVIHRDVKPTNILVGDGGESVFLVDFGIAKIDGDIPLTNYRGTPGTIDYIAPERLQDKEAKPASDLWSLGVTLFFALEGYSPFLRKGEASREATRWAILNDPAPPLKSQGKLAEIVARLLHKEPTRRANAAQLTKVLQAILDGPPAALHLPREPTTNKVAVAKVVKAASPVAEPPLDATQLRDARELVRRASPEDGMAILLAVSEENAAQILAGLRSREAGALIQAIARTRPATAGTMLKILSSSGAGHAVDYINASVAASILTAVPIREAARILVRTNPRTGAQIVMELPHATSVALVKGIPGKRAVTMLEYVWPNTVAELFQQSDELRDKLLGQLESEFRAQVVRYL